jgi:hypothetical protein
LTEKTAIPYQITSDGDKNTTIMVFCANGKVSTKTQMLQPGRSMPELKLLERLREGKT